MFTPTAKLKPFLLALAIAFVCTFAQAQVHEASFQNAGLTLHYTLAGQGSPVVSQSDDAKMAAGVSLIFAADFYDRAAAAKFALTMTPAACHALTSQILETETPTFDYTADLAKLHIPTIIIQGRQDPLDPEMASEARDAIPGSKLLILERAGHFSWLDNPTAFTTALDDFLAPLH